MKSGKNLDTASSLVKNMKLCNELTNQIAMESSEFLNDDELFLLKKNIGELLGFMYLDIYCKNIITSFPELSGTLESEV